MTPAMSETWRFYLLREAIPTKLIYQAQEAEPVYVSIKNSRGDLLLNERYSKTDGFVLPLNMETAASGSYEVEVKGKLGTIKETIVHTSQADLLKERLFIQTKDGMFGVVGFDLGATDFNVLVYNDQSEMIYQDKVTSDGILNKVYNLEEVNSKWVNIVIYHEGDAIISSQLDLK